MWIYVVSTDYRFNLGHICLCLCISEFIFHILDIQCLFLSFIIPSLRSFSVKLILVDCLNTDQVEHGKYWPVYEKVRRKLIIL